MSYLKSELFQSKHQTRLLNDLPQHRLAAGRETLLQPIAPGHEIIHSRARFEGMLYRQSMGKDPRPLAPIGVIKSALVSVDAIA